MKKSKYSILKSTITTAILIVFNLNGYSLILNVKDFGALGDGKTDDTKSVQAAINAASTTTKATIYFPEGIYIIGAYTTTTNYLENYCLKIHSGILFKGEGNKSVIKLRDHLFDKRDTMANAHIFYGNHISNVEFTGLFIDMNGKNNLVPKDIIKNNMAIFIANGSNINLNNITIKDCSGTNMVVLKGTGHGLVIEKSFFYNGGNYVGILTPNKYQIDFSFIYSEWDSSRIFNNRIEQQNIDIALSNYTGGIELHGSYSYASNNTIIGCNPAFYISSSWHSMEKTTVTNNIIEQCLRGISFWVNHSLNNITISNNSIKLTPSRQLNVALIAGIEIPNGNTKEYSFKLANAAPISNLLISGNSIISLLDDSTKDKTVGMVLHSLQNSIIEDNTINGMSYAGVVMQGSKWGMQSVTFKNNKFSNFKTNNDTNAVAGYVVITDTYSNVLKKDPGIKDIQFIDNSFTGKKPTLYISNGKPQPGKFFGAFIALPGAHLNEIHFDKNIFTEKTDIVIMVKTD